LYYRVRDFIRGYGIIQCELSIEEMLQLVETLVQGYLAYKKRLPARGTLLIRKQLPPRNLQ